MSGYMMLSDVRNSVPVSRSREANAPGQVDTRQHIRIGEQFSIIGQPVGSMSRAAWLPCRKVQGCYARRLSRFTGTIFPKAAARRKVYSFYVK
ncbi:hypothetical protein AOX55_00003368 [Sinorhizobium fredii CCBAU 25509]|nr:hypothetical protein SF83666_c31180 [Sinorhizobium fredii CCBAU 83666]AWM26606.1 hypothetical protein AOX55_00003368 [Sinorhizobium fredii CCBAU 25509]